MRVRGFEAQRLRICGGDRRSVWHLPLPHFLVFVRWCLRDTRKSHRSQGNDYLTQSCYVLNLLRPDC